MSPAACLTGDLTPLLFVLDFPLCLRPSILTGVVLSNQQAGFRSHACGGQAQARWLAHAGQTLSSRFREVVRHHSPVLASEPRPSSALAARRHAPNPAGHPAEAGAHHGGVDEFLRGRERREFNLWE